MSAQGCTPYIVGPFVSIIVTLAPVFATGFAGGIFSWLKRTVVVVAFFVDFILVSEVGAFRFIFGAESTALLGRVGVSGLLVPLVRIGYGHEFTPVRW
jgi:hypothetical protein